MLVSKELRGKRTKKNRIKPTKRLVLGLKGAQNSSRKGSWRYFSLFWRKACEPQNVKSHRLPEGKAAAFLFSRESTAQVSGTFLDPRKEHV